MNLAEKQKSQRERLLDHLKEHETVTKAEAFRKYGIWNTGDVIYKLRKRGHDIETHRDHPHDYATYELVETADADR